MKLHTRSIVELHELYHRREGERYVVGDPETGEYLFLSATEFRALQLFQSGLAVGHVRELLKEEHEEVDILHLLHELASRRLIYRIDKRVIHRRAEPHVELAFPAKQFGNPAVKFLLALGCVFGLATIAWRGTFPGASQFLYQESITFAMLAGFALIWLFAFVRQLGKYGQALALGLPAVFGLRSHFHLPLPHAHIAPATEEQHRKVVGTGLLVLLSATLIAGGLAAFYPSGFWGFVFLIGLLEVFGECFLFLDTDLARYLGYRAEVHKLNEQTARSVREEWRLLFTGGKHETHPTITTYTFFYLASYVFAFFIVVTYFVPISLDIVTTALNRFTPLHPLVADASVALVLLTIGLFWYGFSTLRHHPLAHNTLFVNTSLLAIVFASFLAATIATTWASVGDVLIGVVVLYGLGVLLALSFERAVRLAHPFAELHGLFESFVLPVLAACVPLSALFLVDGGVILFLDAGMLAVGMLSALAFHELNRTLSWQRRHATR